MVCWYVRGGGGGGGAVRSRNGSQGGVGPKKPQPSCRGSVAGAPCETATGEGAYGWHGGASEVVVVVGWCVRETRGAERVGQKNRNRAPWLGFGVQ